MAKYLVHFQLFDLVFDLSLSGMNLPHVNSDWESILFINDDLRFHHEIAAQEDIEEVWAGADVVDDLIDAILLLAEVRIHLLNEFGGPALEQWDLLEVVKSFSLLHVLNVEDLVMEVGLLEHKADGDSVRH